MRKNKKVSAYFIEKAMVHSIQRSRSICHFHSMLFFIIRCLSSITKTSRQSSILTQTKKNKTKTYEKHEQQKTSRANSTTTISLGFFFQNGFSSYEIHEEIFTEKQAIERLFV